MSFYYKLTVAYEGTHYCGWQVQDNAKTIQGVMMVAAKKVFGDSVTLTGASRTDSGVHADGQVVLLVGERKLSDYGLPRALNKVLPDDIVVVKSEQVDETFHPRYQDLSKTYLYSVCNGPFHLPKYRHFSMHFRHKLSLELMEEAAKDLIGTHDFKSFASIGTTVEDTVRTIYDIKITLSDSMYVFSITGNGFLYNMVRIIVGTLLEVGNGRRDVHSMPALLESKDRNCAGKTALAKGLTLKSIQYANEGD